MSFLNELKLQYEVSQVPHLSLDDIGLESIVNNIIEKTLLFFKKVKDFFIKIFKWIKEKVLTFLKSKRTKEIIEKVKIIRDIRSSTINSLESYYSDHKVYRSIFTDEEIASIIIEFFNDKNFEQFSLFDFTKNEMIDVSKIYNLLDEEENKIRNFIDLYNKVKYKKGDKTDPDVILYKNMLMTIKDGKTGFIQGSDLIINNFYTHDPLADYKEDIVTKNLIRWYLPIVQNSLFDWLDYNLIDKLRKEADIYYSKSSKIVSSLVKELEHIISNDISNENKFINLTLNYLYGYLNKIALPVRIYSLYIQLMDRISNRLLSLNYLIDPNPPKYKHLYHLSDDPELVKPEIKEWTLSPKIPDSGIKEILPPRISFGDNILNCCYGLEKYFTVYGFRKRIVEYYKEQVLSGNQILYRDLYLYEGETTNNTLFIKEGVVRSLIYDSTFSKEICVASDIKINKVGKVRIYFNKDKPFYDRYKFIRYEFIDEK